LLARKKERSLRKAGRTIDTDPLGGDSEELHDSLGQSWKAEERPLEKNFMEVTMLLRSRRSFQIRENRHSRKRAGKKQKRLSRTKGGGVNCRRKGIKLGLTKSGKGLSPQVLWNDLPRGRKPRRGARRRDGCRPMGLWPG